MGSEYAGVSYADVSRAVEALEADFHCFVRFDVAPTRKVGYGGRNPWFVTAIAYRLEAGSERIVARHATPWGGGREDRSMPAAMLRAVTEAYAKLDLAAKRAAEQAAF